MINEENNYSPKPKRTTIDIPDFLGSNDDYLDSDDFTSAILNNTPGNVQIEEINHLNELETVCQNWKVEEWQRVLYKAPSSMMCDELKRRLGTYEDYLRNTRNNLNVLTEQKM